MEETKGGLAAAYAKNIFRKARPYTTRVFLVCFLSAVVLVIYSLFRVPAKFPSGEVLSVPSGASLQQVTTILERENFISSPLMFRSLVILFAGERRVIAGDYIFTTPIGPVAVAYRLVRGDFGMPAVRVTIPEGWNIRDIAGYLSGRLEGFDADEFVHLAEKDEGYLFPDTYFVPPTETPAGMIARMKNNFAAQVRVVPEIAESDKPLSDIINIASILEEEAKTDESRRIVAGILWKRLSLGMPLQVDSTLTYVTGRTSENLTMADLRIDSPYNTYVRKGFPPTPISNPGLDAIRAALMPIETDYLYFLSSTDGSTMHYAKTYQEHLRNRAKYLE